MLGRPPPPRRPPRAGWRRGGRALALLAAGLLWALAHAAADRPAIRARLRARALQALRARLGEVQLGDRCRVDWLFRAVLGPAVVPATGRGAAPILRVARLQVRPAWAALWRGRLEPASVQLTGVELAPGPGGRELIALAERLRGTRPAPPGGPPAPQAPDPALSFEDLTLVLGGPADAARLGPLRGWIRHERGGGRDRIELALHLRSGGSLRATFARPPRGSGGPGGWTGDAHLELAAADLPSLGVQLPFRLAAGAISLDARASADLPGVEVAVALRGSGLILVGERLGADAIGPFAPSAELLLSVPPGSGRILLQRASLRPLPPLRVEARGALGLTDPRVLALELALAPVDFGALADALPPGLELGPAAPRPSGAFGASLEIAGPLEQPDAWTVAGAVDLSPLRRASRAGSPPPLRAPFTFHPPGGGAAVRVDPGSPDFVPLSALSGTTLRAVTTSEDAGFFAHQGFDFDELRNALAAGAETGRVVRGGSTITQQLAKNLYLSPARTLARKLREALLTIALEGSLSKDRILEIYLNVIEWGRGLRGIGPAARRYLGKDARDLAPREACFLAVLIPNPARYGELALGGEADPWFRSRVDDLLRRMEAAGSLSGAALASELAAPILLAGGRALPPAGAPPPAAPAGPPSGR